MKKGIVITTHKSTEPFLFDLLDSLRECNYPIIIKKNAGQDNTWELGGIKLGVSLFKEFLYLHDTVVIKKLDIIDEIFHPKYHGISLPLFPEFNSYMGKYISNILLGMPIPEIHTKREAVDNERLFTRKYMQRCNEIMTIFPEIDAWKPSSIFENRHGRNNCIYENECIKKYKGTWSEEMIPC
jgi:hypothetical protein